jgi:hypothetical protein
VSWLKKTLGTKDEKQAKVLATPFMMEFYRIIAQAEALLVERPVRTELKLKSNGSPITSTLMNSMGTRRCARRASAPIPCCKHRQLAEAGVGFETPFDVTEEAGSGLSDRMMHKVEEDASVVLLAAKKALARGNINFIRYELNEWLQLFRINLDPACADYRKVARAVIQAEVRA